MKPFKTIEEQISTTWGEDMIQEEFYKLTGNWFNFIKGRLTKMSDSEIKKNTQRDKVYKSKKHVGIPVRPGVIAAYFPNYPENLLEKNIMSQDTYSKSEIDLKLNKISSDTQHGF